MKAILTKLHAIMSEVGYIQKDKKNTMQKYSYLSEAGIKEKIQPLLIAHGVVFSVNVVSSTVSPTSPTSNGAMQYRTDILVEYRFTDIESGEELRGIIPSSGMDTGDKGVFKAITGGIKYALTSTLLIPTGDDPENDEAPVKNNVTNGDIAPFDEPQVDYGEEPRRCEAHNKNLKKNEWGYYCGTKLPDGKWCPSK